MELGEEDEYGGNLQLELRAVEWMFRHLLSSIISGKIEFESF